jgi:hypothetical protein
MAGVIRAVAEASGMTFVEEGVLRSTMQAMMRL